MSVIMDSSPFHQPGDFPRVRSALHPHALHHNHHHRAAIQKRPVNRNRSVSTAQADRLHHIALGHANAAHSSTQQSPSLPSQWLTPQSSPQPHLFTPDPATIDNFSNWTVPTPPRSDSGVPNVTFDSTEIPVSTAITAADFDHFQQPTTAGEMNSLGFLLPSQYGSGTIESEPTTYSMDQSYNAPARMSQPASTGAPPSYAQTTSSSPALYQSKSVSMPVSSSRRTSVISHHSNADPAYAQSYRRPSNAYETMSNGEYSIAPSPSMASVSGSNAGQMTPGPVATPSQAAMVPQYNGNTTRSPSVYDSGMYAQQFSASPSAAQLYASSHSMSYPPPFVGSSVNEVLAKPLGSDASIRMLNQRPKPQCWEHGCNGRQFSTFSNLLRHQREKSGTAAKSYCPKCGAEFTRTTARNGHLAHDKCTKQRQGSEDERK